MEKTGEARSPVEVEGGSGGMDEPEFWGDPLRPRNAYLRVLYNNVNGLKIGDFLSVVRRYESERKDAKSLTPKQDTTKLRGILSAMERWDANVVCCSETQTAWEMHHVREMVAREMRRSDKYSRFIGSSSKAVTCNPYKPGGTMTMIDGNWSCRVTTSVDESDLGRWSCSTFAGRNNVFLTIITAYRCCQGATIRSVGSTSALAQQELLLKRRGITRSPQEMFIVDLNNLVSRLIVEGHEVLLAVDANEEWHTDGSRIFDLATHNGLFDLAKERHGGPVPPTYRRSNCARRIDYLLGSEGVMRSVRAFGIASECFDPVMGDHRPQYVDLDVESLLQLNAHDVGAPTARKLKSANPKSVAAYTAKLRENFKAHNVFDRVETLWEELEGRVVMNSALQEKYEAIDRDVTRLCVNAENVIKHVRNAKYVWSPAIDLAGKMVQYWTLRLRNITNSSKTRELMLWGKRLGLSDTSSLKAAEVTSEISLAKRHLQEIQNKDKTLRIEFLNDLAEKYAADNNVDRSTAIRELMYHEEIREMFRTIRIKLKGMIPPQLSEVWKEGEDGEKVVLSNPQDVENYLLERNWKQLRQAADTPFADGELGDLLNYDGTGSIADDILNGERFPEMETLSDTAQEYIKGMAVNDVSDINTVKVEVTLDEYRSFWKRKRETTVTSPYGLHIGHFRSVLGSDEADILDVHRRLMLIPFRFAYVPHRWAQTVQILLEKDPGAPWTHRLRIIELFDSQLNAGLQIVFGKRMIRNALKRNLLHPSTYGSIPNRTSQDAAMEKTLSLDIMRVTKTCGAIFDCDAKGCYDRIIAALQSVTCRRLGIPRTTSIFFARFWRVCRHFIRTRHGTSRNYYMSSGAEMLYGIGQGNGAGPAFWLSNLVVMFAVLETLCVGMCFESPWKKLYRSLGLGYVDDVTLGCTSRRTDVENDEVPDICAEEEQEVISNITDIGQRWEEMLFTNGGRLELKKCHWILISWRWDRGIAQMKKVEDVGAAMRITQTEDRSGVTISRKSVSDAPRLLGCHIAADGRWQVEFGKWRADGARFAQRVKLAKFKRGYGEKIYNSVWLAKLRYISPVVCFTERESEKINNPVVYQCLPAAGLNRHFPRAVVHGPVCFGGLQWETCFSLQILEKIKFFLHHVRREDKIGHLLQVAVETIQLQAGITESVIDTKFAWEKYTERTWISYLKEGLDKIEGGIMTGFRVPKPPRKFDRALMEIFGSWKLQTKEMEALNRCRVYMKVIFVSDIADIKGMRIEEQAFAVRTVRPSTLTWARQTRPSLGDRRIWEKYLRRLCLNTNELIVTLGKWESPPHQAWKYMVSRDRLTLLRYSDGVQQVLRRTGRNMFSRTGYQCQLRTGYPVQCRITGIGYRVEVPGRRRGYLDDGGTLYPRSDVLRKAIGHITCANFRTLGDLWRSGSDWKCATDGGLKLGVGTCGLVLWNSELEEELVTAMSAERCSLGLLHSTREEIRGLLSAEILLSTCEELFGAGGINTVEFICDSKSAITDAIADIEVLKQETPLKAEMELLLELNRLKSENRPMSRSYKWVKGHQENEEPTVEEKLNVRADELATVCRKNVEEDLIPVNKKQFYEGSKAALHIKGVLINKDYKRAVVHALFADELRLYLMNKYRWDENVWKMIDWESMEHPLGMLKGLHKMTVYKLVHLWQPTNRYVARTEGRTFQTGQCPHCEEEDSQLHYIRCQSDFYNEARSCAWKKFCSKMKRYKHEKTLLRIIWIGIQNWVYNDFDEELPKENDVSQAEYEVLKEAFHQQSEIGWNHFLVGRISNKWRRYYEMRTDGEHSEGRGVAFGRTLVEGIWTYTLQVWKWRNESVHGERGGYSKRDELVIRECVEEVYGNLRNELSDEDAWLFQKSVRIRKSQAIPQILGWMERVLCGIDEYVCENNPIAVKVSQVLHRMSVASIYQ